MVELLIVFGYTSSLLHWMVFICILFLGNYKYYM
jgi:cytochrome b561